MTLEGIVLGLLALAVGLAFTFMGLRLFMILLPIWGLVAGFLVGANAITYLLGDTLLATALGWLVGLALGLLFALFSRLYYWAAVVVLGGSLGYQLSLGVLAWMGAASDWITFLLALVVGALFAVAFLVTGMPALLAVSGSALAGAGAAVAGIVVTLGIVSLGQLDKGIFGVYRDHDLSAAWLVIAIALAVAGSYYQMRTMRGIKSGATAIAITAARYRNPGIGPPSSSDGPAA